MYRLEIHQKIRISFVRKQKEDEEEDDEGRKKKAKRVDTEDFDL